MARPGITYREVAVACDQIVAASEKPTIKRVTEVLGTGSPNTVLRHLNTWRDAAPVAVRKAPELPIELQTAIIKEITRQTAESRDEIEKQLTQSQSEAQELSIVGEALEDHIDRVQSENQGLSNEVQQLSALAEERKQEIAKLTLDLKQERNASEGARLKLAQELNKTDLLNDKANGLINELKALKSDLKLSDASKIEAEKDLAVLAAKYQAEVDKVKKSQDDLQFKETEFLKEKKAAVLLLKTTEDALHQQINTTSSQVEKKIESLLAEHRTREDELNTKNKALMTDLLSSQTIAAEMKGRLLEIDTKNEQSQEALKKKTSEQNIHKDKANT